MQERNTIRNAAVHLEIKEVVEPEDILCILRIVLLQKLQQLNFIQALVEKVFAIFDNLHGYNDTERYIIRCICRA
jgi:hypothetical protein